MDKWMLGKCPIADARATAGRNDSGDWWGAETEKLERICKERMGCRLAQPYQPQSNTARFFKSFAGERSGRITHGKIRGNQDEPLELSGNERSLQHVARTVYILWWLSGCRTAHWGRRKMGELRERSHHRCNHQQRHPDGFAYQQACPAAPDIWVERSLFGQDTLAHQDAGSPAGCRQHGDVGWISEPARRQRTCNRTSEIFCRYGPQACQHPEISGLQQCPAKCSERIVV